MQLITDNLPNAVLACIADSLYRTRPKLGLSTQYDQHRAARQQWTSMIADIAESLPFRSPADQSQFIARATGNK